MVWKRNNRKYYRLCQCCKSSIFPLLEYINSESRLKDSAGDYMAKRIGVIEREWR